MNVRHAIVAFLTFVAGLYFILDYVVPPTMPLATRQGVLIAKTPATLEVQGATYRIEDSDIGRPTVTIATRDTTGAEVQTSLPLRRIHVGDRVTVKRGPFDFGSFSDGELSTADGKKIVLQPGETLSGTQAKGSTVTIEVRNAPVTRLDLGRAALIRKGKREEMPLSGETVLMRIARNDRPAETELADAHVGDTLAIGSGTGFADYRDTASQFYTVITTFAFGMGLLSLGSTHFRSVRRRTKGWPESLFFFVAVVTGLMAGLYKYADPGTNERAFSDVVVLRVLAAVGSAVFSLLAFYMASAAYRAFRVRTLEAALMMASALVVMLGQTPFGTYLTEWMGERFRALWLPNVAAWIMRVPTTAIFRGLIFGIMMGSIATALRYWLSAERSAAMRD